MAAPRAKSRDQTTYFHSITKCDDANVVAGVKPEQLIFLVKCPPSTWLLVSRWFPLIHPCYCHTVEVISWTVHQYWSCYPAHNGGWLLRWSLHRFVVIAVVTVLWCPSVTALFCQLFCLCLATMVHINLLSSPLKLEWSPSPEASHALICLPARLSTVPASQVWLNSYVVV